MKKIEVKTQSDLDNISDDFQGEIRITGEIYSISRPFPNASVYVYGNAQIRYVYGNAQIRYVYGNAQISNVYGNAQISNVDGNAQISNVDGNAQISNVDGNAAVLFVGGEASVQTGGQNIVSVYTSKKKTVQLDLSKGTTLVMLDEINSTFEGFQKFYPFEIKGKDAILYKAVHKVNGAFVSDHNKNYTYEIGKKHKHDCAPASNGSCAEGLHISHKMWALRFGNSWSDMALLECKVPISKIIIAKDCDGKVRTSELTVIREVPEAEYFL